MAGCHLKGKSEFLVIRPKVFGGLEILIGILGIVLSFWTGFFSLLLCFSVLTGAVTVSAANKQTMCWIRTSQILNFMNGIIAFISFSSECKFLPSLWTAIVLMLCDFLVFILYMIVASTAFSKCCYYCRPRKKPQERRLTRRRHSVDCHHMNRSLPKVTVNNIVFVTQSNSAATPSVFSSVQYTLPSEHRPVCTRL